MAESGKPSETQDGTLPQSVNGVAHQEGAGDAPGEESLLLNNCDLTRSQNLGKEDRNGFLVNLGRIFQEFGSSMVRLADQVHSLTENASTEIGHDAPGFFSRNYNVVQPPRRGRPPKRRVEQHPSKAVLSNLNRKPKYGKRGRPRK